MDKQQGQQCRVKPFFFYLKDSLKFYDIDKQTVAQIIFILILATIFGGYVIARPFTEDAFFYYGKISEVLIEQFETKNIDLSLVNMENVYKMVESMLSVMAIYIAIKAVAYIFATYYGVFYYYSLVNPDTTWTQRTGLFLNKIIKIIGFNVLFYGIFAISILLIFALIALIALFIPAISLIITFLPLVILAIDMLFIFKNLLIIEFDTGIIKNFKVSLVITEGCKKRVILNGLWPHFLGLILGTFAIDVQNPLLSLFIVSFFEVIVLLIFQRLTALMFIDAASLESKNKRTEVTQDIR